MNGKLKLAIMVTSLCISAALFWGGAAMALALTHWLAGHQEIAKVMPFVAGLIVPAISFFVLYRRRDRSVVSD